MPEEAITEKETPKEETPEETEGGALFTPEGVLMLCIAVMLDLIGLFLFILSLFGIGIPLSFILDIIGLVIIGTWMFLRSGRIGMTKKAAKVSRKFLKRLGLAFLGEVIPFFGDIA
ncbi:hypothetical protein KJA17_02095, partial [Patescibacteria group bacterium]|nr:hypothetical protein [Patescibacteria group bacterium]